MEVLLVAVSAMMTLELPFNLLVRIFFLRKKPNQTSRVSNSEPFGEVHLRHAKFRRSVEPGLSLAHAAQELI